MKHKYVAVSKEKFDKWCCLGNILAKSLCPHDIILEQYNNLSASHRLDIKREFEKYDQIRNIKIPKNEKYYWEVSIMVDAHIIACEFGVDPLTVILCLKPICKANEKIFIK